MMRKMSDPVWMTGIETTAAGRRRPLTWIKGALPRPGRMTGVTLRVAPAIDAGSLGVRDHADRSGAGSAVAQRGRPDIIRRP